MSEFSSEFPVTLNSNRSRARQAHYLPRSVTYARSPEEFLEPYAIQPKLVTNTFDVFEEEVVDERYSVKWLTCGECYERVRSDQTEDHVCEE